MEIIEDVDVSLSTIEALPSPLFKPKLKRLKKSVVLKEVRVSEVSIVEKDEKSENYVDSTETPNVESVSFETEKKIEEEELDPLFSLPAFADEGFESMDLEEKKSARKKLVLDEEIGDDLKWNKKRKRKSGSKFEGKSQEHVPEKKISKKERKAALEQIHADSQRLLRETRDASFKSVPLVQKPISSVLEKIRRRKLEVTKQTSFLSQSDVGSISDYSNDEFAQKKSEKFEEQHDVKADKEAAKVDDTLDVQTVGNYTCTQDFCKEVSGKEASKVHSEGQSPIALNDTQEAAKSCIPSNVDNDHLEYVDDEPSCPLPPSDFNPDLDNILAEEEEENDDKVNISPCPITTNNDSSQDSQEAGLAKVFLDDEAEEEDDSDEDMLRFKDNEEEDDESDEEEVLKDLIATNYDEASVDQEKRNLLHQKWLEQQDAAGTDDILQRLKYGSNQKMPSCLDDIDDCGNFDAESEAETDDEKSNDQEVMDNTRSNKKKVKQMIVQMFNDETDVYEHSDDEAAEQALLRQRVLKKIDPSTFISPVEDENSREVFSLIKKTNSLPSTKKKGKAVASSLDSILASGNSDSSSKSSFLNRSSSFSLPSKPKQVSTTMRAYIFNRDDSKSRGAADVPNETVGSDQDPKESQPSKQGASKISSKSQIKSTVKTKIESTSKSSSNSSLFQILKRSSIHFDKKFSNNKNSSQNITESQAAYQFSSFKLGMKATKVESRK